MTDDADISWDDAYEGDPPWDIGRPQPAFVALAETGGIEGRVLDAGCGTGEHAAYFAERGHDVTGVDVSEGGIERAREKARQRGVDVEFRVADALDLPGDLGRFDTVVDCGLYHVFDRAMRDTYVENLARVVASGGRAFVFAFAEGAPDDWGPNPVPRAEFEEVFGDGWRVAAVREESYLTVPDSVPGYLATVDRDDP